MRQDEKLLRDKRRRRAKALRNPTPVELPSGAYRCQVTVCGQRISVTDADPDVARAKALAMKAELIQKEKRLPQQMTLRQVVENYIASKRPLLSPATLRGYRTILDNRFPEAMQQNPARLTEQQWQAYINQDANRCSAKTLKNAWALISAAVKQESGLDLHVSLPPVVRHARAYLDYEQIPRFVDAVRDQPCELPALLALCSLRRSEIVDLCWQDIDVVRSLIHVDGAAVFGEDEVLIYKETNKNETSQRTVPILIPRIAEIVSASTAPADTRIVSCNPNTPLGTDQRRVQASRAPTRRCARSAAQLRIPGISSWDSGASCDGDWRMEGQPDNAQNLYAHRTAGHRRACRAAARLLYRHAG